MANDLAMCMRYYSVTFRGQPLTRMVLGGGEATAALLKVLEQRVRNGNLSVEICMANRDSPHIQNAARSTL